MMKNLLKSIILAGLPGVAFATSGLPAAPGLTAVADPTGLLKVTVTVTAPLETEDGDPLTDISRMELKRGGEVIRTFDNVVPGEKYDFTDTSLTTGYIGYSVSAFTSVGEGVNSVVDRVYVGVDVPLPPSQLRVVASADKFSFTWPKSEKTGVNGERVRQDGLTYMLEELNDSYEPRKTLSESKTQAFDYYYAVDSGTQDVLRFGLRAYNITGYSDYIYVKTIIGAPYYFPYRESFAGGLARGLVWQDGDADFLLSTEDDSDGDSGCLLCVPAADGSVSSFNLGKICMANTESPRLSFRLKGLAEGETMVLKVARADGAEASLLTVNGPVEDWTLKTVDLSKLKRERYIIAKFVLGEGNTSELLIDDIRFEDPYKKDLGIFVKAPETAYGETKVDIEVTNEGLEPSDGGWIFLSVNGEYIGNLHLDKALQSGETTLLETTVNVDGTASVEVKAHIKWDLDVNPANDIASAQILPVPPTQDFPGSSSVENISEGTSVSRIMTVDGTVLQSTDTDKLPKGLYIIDGRKTIIR